MRQHDSTGTSLMIGLASMALLGSWSMGPAPLEASSSQSPEAENSQIMEGSKVTFQFVTTVPGSPGLPSGTGVSEFVQGRHEIFPALEQAVAGMKPGQAKRVELSPEEGFGPHVDGKKLVVSKTQLPPGVKQGDVVQNALGEFATVAAMGETTATVDYNHPLAGKPIVVQIKILNVENP